MKRLLVVLIAISMLFTFVACGEGEVTSSDPASSEITGSDVTSSDETSSDEVSSNDTSSTESEEPTSGAESTTSTEATHTHTWGSWKTETQALVGKDGIQRRVCSTCYTSETRTTTDYALENSFLYDYNLGWFMGDWPVNDGLGSYYPDTPANQEGIQGGTILNYLGADYNESDRTDMDFTISFSNAVAYLSTKFKITDSLKAEMKADCRYDSATDSFNLTYPGTTPVDVDTVEGYVHNGGNNYTVYYSVSHRHGTTPTYWKAEIEYNLPDGNNNKYISLVGVESLPNNLTK